MPNSQMPTKILLSLTTAPFLLVLIGSKALSELLKEAGQATEEIFRGDRLPILKISHLEPRSNLETEDEN
jgi:hypothetical protein